MPVKTSRRALTMTTALTVVFALPSFAEEPRPLIIPSDATTGETPAVGLKQVEAIAPLALTAEKRENNDAAMPAMLAQPQSEPSSEVIGTTAETNLDMNGFRIMNLGDPTSGKDATHRDYVDQAALNARDNLGNHSATAAVDMNGFPIIDLPTPGASHHAATKGYTDGKIADVEASVTENTSDIDKNTVAIDGLEGRKLITGTGLSGGGSFNSDIVIEFDDEWGDTRYTFRSRRIDTGDGLEGGGNLTGDRTLSVDNTVVRTSRTISTGTGLKGGGPLSANVGVSLDTDFTDDRYTSKADGEDVKTDIETLQGIEIQAGTGLTGGGQLNDDVTLNFDQTYGDTRYTLRSEGDEVRTDIEEIRNTRITAGVGLDGGGLLGADMVIEFDEEWGDARYTFRSRVIEAGDGLQGGGDLSADRTVSVDDTVVRTSRIIAAGSGLNGGGNLGDNVALAVDDSVLRTWGEQTISGKRVHTGQLQSQYAKSGKAAVIIARPIDDPSDAPALIVANDGDKSDIIAEFRSNPSGPNVDVSDDGGSSDAKFIIYGNGSATFTGKVSGADPSQSNHFATMGFVQSAADDARDDLGSHTATTHLQMSGFRVENLGDPDSGDDAVSRDFGDGRYARQNQSLNTENGIVGGGLLASDLTIGLDDTVFRRGKAIDGDLRFASGNGNGLRFNSGDTDDEGYRIYVSSAIDGDTGGSLDQTSTTNMYFVMPAGSNADGFVFKTDGEGGGPIFQIDGDGGLWTSDGDGNGIQIRDANGGWVITHGKTGWKNETYGGGFYQSDQTWIRTQGDKNVITGGVMQANEGFKVDGKFVVNADGSLDANWMPLVAVPLPQKDDQATPRIYVDDLVEAVEGRSVLAGDGLSGGGTLTSDVTISLDDTVVRTTGTQVIEGRKHFESIEFFGDANSYDGLPDSGLAKFGRDQSQFLTLYGGGTGNVLESVSNPAFAEGKDFKVRVRFDNVDNPAFAEYVFGLDGIADLNRVNVVAGNKANPSIMFNDTDTGIFAPTAGRIGFSSNGKEQFRVAEDRVEAFAMLDMNNIPIVNLPEPTGTKQAVTLGYANKTYATIAQISGSESVVAKDITDILDAREVKGANGISGSGKFSDSEIILTADEDWFNARYATASTAIATGDGLTVNGSKSATLGGDATIALDDTVFTANGSVAGNIITSGYGNGLRFGSSKFSIFLSTSEIDTPGSRLDNKTAMNTYFEMGGSKLRGWVFSNESVPVYQLDAYGNHWGMVNGDGQKLRDANGGWVHTYGDSGISFTSWGGGFYMSDADWIRSENDKGIYTGGAMRADGGFQIGDGQTVISNTGQIRAGGQVIANVGTPTDVNHASTKGYVDGAISSAMSGINLTDVTNPGDAASKQYVDTQVDGAKDNLGSHAATMTLTMGGNAINMGGGDIIMGSGVISGLSESFTGRTDAASQGYVDDAVADAKDHLGNHTATQTLVLGNHDLTLNGGDIALSGGSRITGLPNPLSDNDAVSNIYVAQNYVGITSSQTIGGSKAFSQEIDANGGLDARGGDVQADEFYGQGYFYASDARLKTDVLEISSDDAMTRLMKLEPVSYNYINTGAPSMGLIAQDVQTLFPSAVTANDEGMLAVDYQQLIAPMLAMMQSQQETIADLKAQLALLQAGRGK